MSGPPPWIANRSSRASSANRRTRFRAWRSSCRPRWILILALRGERATRTALVVLAIAVVANAVGSFARHGPDPSWAQWAHDAAIMAVLLFVAVHALGRSRGWRSTVEIGAYAVGLAAVGLGLAAIHGASDPFAGTLAAGAVVGEIATVSGDRRARSVSGARSRTVARGVGLVAIAFGGIAFLLGRTGSPLCRPDSVFQWHALWHVLVADLARGVRVRDLRPAGGSRLAGLTRVPRGASTGAHDGEPRRAGRPNPFHPGPVRRLPAGREHPVAW